MFKSVAINKLLSFIHDPAATTHASFNINHTIYAPGERVTRVYFVKSGEVAIVASMRGGASESTTTIAHSRQVGQGKRTKQLVRLSVGCYFGDEDAFNNK